MEFGPALKKLRTERGWRQEDLVAALDHQFARSTLANVETGRERPSARMWEQISTSVPEWVDALAPAYEAARREAAEHPLPRTARAAERRDDAGAAAHRIGGPYRIESLHLVYTFRYSQVPEEIIEVRRVRALQSGATGYGLKFSATGTADFSVEEEALWGGSLSAKHYVTTEHNVHYLRRFEFGRSLRRGQVHDFAVRSWVERDPNPDTEILFSVTLPTDAASVHVNFAGPVKPQDVWSFGPLADSELSPKTLSQGGTPLTPSPDGNVSYHVSKPVVGGHYGVGWAW